MLANKMQMATGAGAAAFVTATLEGAPPFVLVGSWVNVFPYKIMAQKGIRKVEDLKGKTGHVGAPFGTIPDTALRFALNRLKIDADKDVKLVQHSNADPASILAAMEKGEVQFGILAPPFDLIAERRGYEMLLALPGLGIPWQQNGEIVPASYLKSNRDNVVRLMRATADASKFYFDQKEKTLDIMTEYLGRPRDEAEYAYNQFKRWVDKNHRPQVDTIKTTLEAIKKNTPKAATANAASFIDTSIVDQLTKEGYYK
jgi:ABC-type nitrate/sulfonate/bicarbonate transport system substrate-binding protein